MVIPPSARDPILCELHVGHLGVNRMKALAKSFVWWPGLDNPIVECEEMPDHSQSNERVTGFSSRLTEHDSISPRNQSVEDQERMQASRNQSHVTGRQLAHLIGLLRPACKQSFRHPYTTGHYSVSGTRPWFKGVHHTIKRLLCQRMHSGIFSGGLNSCLHK